MRAKRLRYQCELSEVPSLLYSLIPTLTRDLSRRLLCQFTFIVCFPLDMLASSSMCLPFVVHPSFPKTLPNTRTRPKSYLSVLNTSRSLPYTHSGYSSAHIGPKHKQVEAVYTFRIFLRSTWAAENSTDTFGLHPRLRDGLDRGTKHTEKERPFTVLLGLGNSDGKEKGKTTRHTDCTHSDERG